MKNLLLLFLIFLLPGLNTAFGQLSGSYTLGSEGDFSSLAEAFSTLMQQGNSGDVIFLIQEDLNESENVFLGFDPSPHTLSIRPAEGAVPVVTFSSATSNSNINGALVFGASSDDWNSLTPTRNIVIDGSNNGTDSRDLSFVVSASSNTSNYFRIVGNVENLRWKNTDVTVEQQSFDTILISPLRTNGADFLPSDISIINNRITSQSGRTSSRAINIWGVTGAGFSTPESAPGLINIRDNEIEARRYGVWLRTMAGSTSIIGNQIQISEPGTLQAYGILIDEILDENGAVEIRGNNFSNSSAGGSFSLVSINENASYSINSNLFSNLSAGNVLRVIEIESAADIMISANEISGIKGDGGVEAISFSSNITDDYSATLVNNMITGFASDGSGESLFGVIFRSPEFPATAELNMFYNTIRMNPIEVSGSGWTYRGLSVFSNARLTVNLLNNIFINEDNNGSEVTSYAYAQLGSATATFSSDFNLWYVANPGTANTWLSRHGGTGTNTTTLAGHQNSTSQDENSVFKAVEFVSGSNLRLTGDSDGDPELAGTPIPSVTTDIDGSVRNPNLPYKGAFEASPLSPLVLIGGTQGWRLLSSPTNETLSALLDPIWTQGAEGSNFPETSESNVFFFSDAEWQAVDDLNQPTSAGSGIAVYVFDQDDFDDPDSAVWPKVLSLNGALHTGTVDVPMQIRGDAFTLAGNPFFSAIDFNELTRNQMRNQVFVYSHSFDGPFDSGDDAPADGDSGGGWRTWNGTAGSLTNGIIAPFQGFFVRNDADADAPSLSIPESAQTDDDAEFYNLNEPSRLQLAARLNGKMVSDLWISFTDHGSENLNAGDVPSLYPIDYIPFLSLFTETDGQPLDIRNLPSEIAESVQIPLYFEAWDTDENNLFRATNGSIELIWPVMDNLPHYWNVYLYDHHTGTEINLRTEQRYLFELEKNEVDRFMEHQLAIKGPELSSKNAVDSRLSLIIAANPTSTQPENELPGKITLSQNYPNPFNPTTNIRYTLPENTEVSLEVFNIQGQRVSTLVNGTQQAGVHTAQFDATNLASGVYIYRLRAGSVQLTNKMMLIK
ncbi:MAG: T9SS type A sorting domain-containing protein [Balneolales bacterium]|nr:T9SS type A sorting domain-containing protein [Balneolales bacterium]